MNNFKKISLLISVLFIFVVCLFSCSSATQNSNDLTANQNTRISNANTNQFNVAEFERNRELWTSKSIENYKMIVGASGFLTNFPEKVLIEVRNRQTKSIKSLSKTDRNYVEAYKNYDNIEKLFGFIENEARLKAHKLEVKYNENLSYPSYIYVDEHSGFDDKLSLTVENLEIIK